MLFRVFSALLEKLFELNNIPADKWVTFSDWYMQKHEFLKSGFYQLVF